MLLFLVIGIGLLASAWIILRFTKSGQGGTRGWLRRNAWLMLPFGLIWSGFTLWMSVGEIRSAQAARTAMLNGSYQTLEGCLDYFRPGEAMPGRGTSGDERWAVKGHAFSYGAGEVRFAYHKVEPLGGIVHRDSRVRVSFVRSDFHRRDDIIRLEVTQAACPDSPDAPRL
jgi:hypothetical protein